MLKKNDLVYKPTGYSFQGKILSCFVNHELQTRLAVEEASSGMIHIFNDGQLELAKTHKADQIAYIFDNRDYVKHHQEVLINQLMSGITHV